MTKVVKISATGNTFLVLEDKNGEIYKKKYNWASACLKTQVDGIIFKHPSSMDMKMTYLNADGNEVEMCGNGLRAITFYEYVIKENKKKRYEIETMNSVYYTEVFEEEVQVRMTELRDYGLIEPDWFKEFSSAKYMNTGVPHCVLEVEHLEDYDVFGKGRKLSHDPLFARGCNINFFELQNSSQINVRTYERGVENETLACGTGISAVVHFLFKERRIAQRCQCNIRGGTLLCEIKKNDVYLRGKVELREKYNLEDLIDV